MFSKHLHQFINKRQEGFLTIAEQHQYLLRIKFQNLITKSNPKFNYEAKKYVYSKEIVEFMTAEDLKTSDLQKNITKLCKCIHQWNSEAKSNTKVKVHI